MLPVSDEPHRRPRQFVGNPLHLPRFRSRIKAPMQKQCRHTDPAQFPVIQIFIDSLHGIRNPKPSRAIPPQNRRPLPIPVVLRQQPLRLLTQIFRARCESLEECSRSRLSPQQVESFQNQALATLRRHHPDHRADHRPIAVSPKHCSPNPHRIKKCDRFLRGSPVKIQRHLSPNSCRVPIPRAVRDQDPELPLKRLDLPIKWIDSIPPASMQKNQRPPAPKLPIANRDGTDVRRMRRMVQLQSRHLTSLPKRIPDTRTHVKSVSRRTHARYITTETSQTQGAMLAILHL
jgi:hypothetical protein